MTSEIANKLLETDTLTDLMNCYQQYMGEPLQNVGQLVDIDKNLSTHLTKLMRKEHEGTPFAPCKMPDGTEVHISPGIGAWEKKTNNT